MLERVWRGWLVREMSDSEEEAPARQSRASVFSLKLRRPPPRATQKRKTEGELDELVAAQSPLHKARIVRSSAQPLRPPHRLKGTSYRLPSQPDSQALLDHFGLPSPGLPERDRAAIDAALTHVLERREAGSLPQLRKNASSRQRLSDAKELFFARFTRRMVQQRIDEYRDVGAARRAGVELHERRLKQDVAGFLAEFVARRSQYGAAQAELKRLKTRRNEQAQELLRRQVALEAARADNRKKEETVADMARLRDFIEKLSPAAFCAQRAREALRYQRAAPACAGPGWRGG